MAISKETFVGAMKDARTCMDQIYERKSDASGCLVAASPTMPQKPVHWIRPSDDKAVAFEATKVVTSATQPVGKDTIWINTGTE